VWSDIRLMDVANFRDEADTYDGAGYLEPRT
jgi:hypothetical protein